jgi:hypothetical protein
MKILILDDQQLRHDTFARVYEGHEVVSCFKYSDYVSQLTQSWDLIHLDHDLGDDTVADTYVDGWGKTQEYNGQHATMRLCELPDELKPKRVIIQSINNVAAPIMKDMLERAGIPVSWEPFQNPSKSEDTLEFSTEQEKQIREWARSLKS